MSASKRTWIVAASIYAVETLKDQGICRWNYTLRLAKNNLSRSSPSLRSEARSEMSLTTAMATCGKMREEKKNKSEKSMKKVMELNSWGPNTIRF
ncbi:2-nonaprenyl-3-methyl-6-methoxy-1,4-benzoquinol hydroxylase [Hibiscus syriacus]|uniref:2-nonaprenyl-3-methyl-6-methoxy-1,4-benzoquinol hydroxylase n=1 Tax=Hibiscus syriacus TaxID=106335 RepID=A0A6A2WG03_HIBSY|nr:2-nonaprenyl-3-methyl-6-methoxy-1,4-benzoquinol hydroxylase [Hibiscus syriacus]